MRWTRVWADFLLFCLGLGLIGFTGMALSGEWIETFDLVNHFLWLKVAGLIFLTACLYLAYRESASLWARRWIRFIALPFFCLALSGLGLAAWLIPSTPRVANTSTSGEIIRLATHNVWGRNQTPERATDLLVASGAHIVGVQETFGTSHRVPDDLRAHFPYSAACSAYAVALVSLYPIEESGCLPRSEAGDYPPPGAWALIRLPSGKLISVVTVHMTWPEPLHHQGQQRRALNVFLKRFDPKTLIVMGDFNAAAPSFALRRIERTIGLPRRTHHLATWPSHRNVIVGEDKHWPWLRPLAGIDHVFAGRNFVTLDVHAGDDTGSDHRPVIATLALMAD